VDAAARKLNLRVRTNKMDLEAKALDVNGMSLGEVGAGMSPMRAMLRLCGWLHDGTRKPRRWLLGGKNPQFDFGFLAEEWPDDQLGKLTDLISRRAVDLHSIAYEWAIRAGMDLAADDFQTEQVYAAWGIPREPEPHHALRGARIEMLGFRRVLEDRVPTESEIQRALEPTREDAETE